MMTSWPYAQQRSLGTKMPLEDKGAQLRSLHEQLTTLVHYQSVVERAARASNSNQTCLHVISGAVT